VTSYRHQPEAQHQSPALNAGRPITPSLRGIAKRRRNVGKDQKAQTKSPRSEIWGFQLRKWISYQNL
jgi:hypothetical protein